MKHYWYTKYWLMSAKITRLSAVSVCVNYSEQLSKCIENKKHFDEWIIVTSKNDLKTIQLCKTNELKCITFENIYKKSGMFDQSKRINKGLKTVGTDKWVLLIDPDIYLPNNFRELLGQLPLNNECIYTINDQNREEIISPEEFDKKKMVFYGKKISVRPLFFQNLKNMNIKVFHSASEIKGPWYFAGFFQLFCSKKGIKYTEKGNGLSFDDVKFVIDNFNIYQHRSLEMRVLHFGEAFKSWAGKADNLQKSAKTLFRG